MKIAFTERETQAVILELLRPWTVELSSIDEADVIVSRTNLPKQNSRKTLLIPSDSSDFNTLVKANQKDLTKENSRILEVHVAEDLVLSITPKSVYSYGRTKISAYGCLASDSIYFLNVDVVTEYNRVLSETFNVDPSFRYKLFTSLPIPYTLAPKRLRDIVMTNKSPEVNLDLNEKLPIDALRFIIVKALEQVTNKRLDFSGSSFGKKKTTYLFTHDIDSRKGLDNALRVKQLEEKYDVASVWYVPSNHYQLDSNILRKLANHGEVGSHDTEHDGKLARIKDRKLVNRLIESKTALEKAGNCTVNGFRAPLLQHNFQILEGLKKAGFTYDSSVPTFEPNHPRTMGPHGIGTVYPIAIGGFLEIPITFVQDHQLLYTLGLKPDEVIAQWQKTALLIKTVGGCCVTLSHPEYQLLGKDGLSFYEDLLNQLKNDSNVEFNVPQNFNQAKINGKSL